MHPFQVKLWTDYIACGAESNVGTLSMFFVVNNSFQETMEFMLACFLHGLLNNGFLSTLMLMLRFINFSFVATYIGSVIVFSSVINNNNLMVSLFLLTR